MLKKFNLFLQLSFTSEMDSIEILADWIINSANYSILRMTYQNKFFDHASKQ